MVIASTVVAREAVLMSGSSHPDIHNERTRLTASWTGNFGVGLVVVGAVTPLIRGEFSTATVFGAIVATGFGLAAHLVARNYLRRLQ